MSASSMPQVGPAMICASSSTRMPASGPVWGGSVVIPSPCGARLGRRVRRGRLLPGEIRRALVQEGRIADAKVLGVEAIEAFLVLRGRNRALLRQEIGRAPRRERVCQDV